MHSVLGTDLGKRRFSITYTKNTNSATASRSYEGQGSFSPETYTRLYTNKKFQATKWYAKKRSQVFVKYMIIFFTSWATREAHSAPYKCYTNNEPGVRTQLPHLCFSLLKDTPDQKEVLKIYRKEHSAYKAMEVSNSSYSKIWNLLTKVKKVIQAGLTNLHN